MDVQTLRMLVWWIAGGKCPEWWRLLGFSAFLGFSSYCQYTDCTILLGSTHHQSSRGGGSSNLKKPNTPMSKFACQAELQESSPLRVSCPLGENETRLRQVTRRFCARILTHNLQTTNCLCLMSRTLSPDELILLLSVSGSVAQELSP